MEVNRSLFDIGLPEFEDGNAQRIRETMPPELSREWIRPDEPLKARGAVPVLAAALRLLLDGGWCQGAFEDGTGRHSLYGALVASGVGAEVEYARQQLRAVLWTDNLPGWNDHPARRKAEVTQALRRAKARALREAGMVRRGGWRVSR